MATRNVRYFEKPGGANTAACIEAAREYLDSGGEAAAVIVASISGKTALRMREGLGDSPTPVICVSGPPCWESCYPEAKYKPIAAKMRSDLDKAGVAIVDSVPSTLTDTIESSLGRYGLAPASLVFSQTLIAVGGYGLKTALECVLMATDGGHVRPFRDVIAIAGTDKGADTAVVVRATFSPLVFSANPRRRLVVKELLAMPRNKTFYKNVRYGEWQIEETK